MPNTRRARAALDGAGTQTAPGDGTPENDRMATSLRTSTQPRCRTVDGHSIRCAEREELLRRDALMSPRAMGEFVVRLADEFGLEQPHVVGPTSARVRHSLSDAAREDYLSSYEGERFADSMAYVRAYPTDLRFLGAPLPEICTPVMIVAGRQDPVIPLINAEFINARLPNGRLAVVDAGHFTWEDTADEYAGFVTSRWDVSRDSKSGHAESVRVTFDPSALSYEALREGRALRPTT